MDLKRITNKSIIVAIAIFVFGSCKEENKYDRKIKFEDFSVLNDTTNLYVYKDLSFLSESSESYFAIGKSFCDVYNDSLTTFASTLGFSQIDTIISTKAYIASPHEILFLRYPKGVSFEVRLIKPMDKLKRRLNFSLIDTCR